MERIRVPKRSQSRVNGKHNGNGTERIKPLKKRGRPKGSRNIDALVSREKMAKELGLLPHEFLALVAAGQTITVRRFGTDGWSNEVWHPSPEQQIAAAIAAAPYYQPKLVSQKIEHSPIMMQLDQSKIQQLPDQMLQALEILITSLIQTGGLPVLESPKTIEHEDEYDEVFQ